MAVRIAARDGPPGSAGPLRLVRRSSDLWLAFALGGGVALLILSLPMPAALASSIVGAFVLLALVDTRVAVLALFLARSAVDVTTTIPLLSASGASNVNATAMTSLLVILLGLSHIAMSRMDVRRVPLVMPFGAFVGITFLGIAIAPDHNRALQEWLRIFGTLMAYILCVDVMRTHVDRRWLVRVMLLSSIVPLLAGVYQYLTDNGNHDTPGFNRIFGTFVHPSPYGFYLVQLLPLAVVFCIHTRSRIARVGLAVMVPLMLFSIYATETRAAWLGVVVMIMVLMWTRARWTLLLIPLAAGAVYFGVPSVRARINEATSGTCESRTNCQSSVFWRQKQWEDAIRIPSPPLLVTVGAGLGAVEVDLGYSTHNEYVRLLVEVGALGCIAIFVLYRRLFEIALRAYRDAPTSYQRDLALAFITVLISRLVMAASDNILAVVVIEWYFWAFAAVIVVESGAYDRFARLREREHRSGRAPRLPEPAAASQASTP